jgi:hypothetical protein
MSPELRNLLKQALLFAFFVAGLVSSIVALVNRDSPVGGMNPTRYGASMADPTFGIAFCVLGIAICGAGLLDAICAWRATRPRPPAKPAALPKEEPN